MEQHKIILEPLEGRLVVSPVTEADVTEGGVLLLETRAKEKPMMGTVVAMSADTVVTRYAVGRQVLFSRYAGIDYTETLTGESYLILRETDILGVLADLPDEAIG